MNISTRSIVIAGVLIAVAAVLNLTGLAFFPVPNVTAQGTILHVPTIIGGVLEGPLVGGIVGLVFGIFTYFAPGVQALFVDRPFWVPVLVLIVPRILVGIFAWLTYEGMRKSNEIVAIGTAAVVGTLTNTILVVGLGVLLGILPAAIIPTLAPQVIAEVVVAAILTIAVVAAYKGIARGQGRSSV